MRSMCCRLRLDLRELRKKSGGFFGSGESTGSVGVVTINLPRIAYLAKDEADFYQRLDKLMDISARSLKTKRTVITKLLDAGLYPYTKRYLGNFDNHFSTIGLIGMNEVGLNASWLRADLTQEKTQAFAKDVLNHMRERLSDYQEQYGDLYNLEATPAESTTYRFAKHDKAEFPGIITANENGTPYYTNSSHLPVGYTEDIFSALDVQDELQTLYTSGTVFHAFLGEKLPSWQAAAALVRKIAENYKLPYYTMSPTYSVCADHGYLSGEQYTCPICGRTTEVYSRITGYYRPVQNWNDGKTQEFKDRKVYDISASQLRRAGRAGPRSPRRRSRPGRRRDGADALYHPHLPQLPPGGEPAAKGGHPLPQGGGGGVPGVDHPVWRPSGPPRWCWTGRTSRRRSPGWGPSKNSRRDSAPRRRCEPSRRLKRPPGACLAPGGRSCVKSHICDKIESGTRRPERGGQEGVSPMRKTDIRYQTYLKILEEELLPAMGCTEPIAVAYAAAMARDLLGSMPVRMEVNVSGNILKNVKSVVVPNTGGLRGSRPPRPPARRWDRRSGSWRSSPRSLRSRWGRSALSWSAVPSRWGWPPPPKSSILKCWPSAGTAPAVRRPYRASTPM